MAASALADVLMRHQVALQRLSAAEVRKVDKFIDQISSELQRRLSGQDLTSLAKSRLERALERLNGYLADTLSQYRGEIMSDLKSVAEHEAQYTTKALNGAVPVNVDTNFVSPTALQIQTAALESPLLVKGPDGGKLLKTFLTNWTAVEKTRISNAIRLGVATGQTNASIVQSIRGTAAMNYGDGILALTKSNADKVVHTAVQHVANSVRQAVFEANDDLVSGIRWLSTLDNRTCVQCGSLDLVEFPIDSGPRPPAHIFCFPGDTLITARHRITAAFKRRFDGQLIVIRSAAGNEFACTPNHPILTGRGWTAAHDLRVGDDLFRDTSDRSGSINHDHKNVPARIEEIAQAFFSAKKVLARPVPVTAEDFHGDGMEGDVAVVWADRRLLNGAEAAGHKSIDQRAFISGRVRASRLSGKRSFEARFEQLRSTTQRLMCRLRETLALLRRRTLHARKLLVRSVSQAYSSALQQALNWRSAYAELVGNTAHAYPFVVERKDLPGGEIVPPHAFGYWRESDPGFGQPSIDDVSRDAQLARDIIDGKFGPVETDRILSCEVRDFNGHVYNLETETGFYFAGGIVAHNCRCTAIPVLKGELANILGGGERPSIGDGGAEAVPGKTNYFNWLKDQPASFQDFAIGPSRGALLRNGGLSASRFAQMNLDKRFTPLSLVEMKKIEPTAFDDAGVDA